MTYRNPTPTVDVIIEVVDETGNRVGIVLIERANAPHGWALPGGFVDYGEAYPDAAVREALEETGLVVELVELFHVYSHPDRDPRQHTASTVYIGRATGVPTGQDDARQAGIFALDALPSPLAFDHGEILADFAHYREHGAKRTRI